MATPTEDSNRMLAAAVAAAEDKKAEDIVVLKLDPSEGGLFDYMLICTGTNTRQTSAIADAIELKLKREFGLYCSSVEGHREGEWVLMDFFDFIVHIFTPEKRAYYGLERLRKTATTVSAEDLNAELKAETSKVTAKRAGAKKTVAKKAVAKKTAAKKTVAKKAAKAPAKTVAPVKAAAKKTVAVKAVAKTVAVKAAATKTPAKKTAAKKAVAKKTTAKKTARA